MASFVVMEPPRGERAQRDAAIVRDGFVWFGFLMPFLWLLWHRLWLEAAVVLLVALGIGLMSSRVGFAGAPALSLLLSFYVGLEGTTLRIARLARRGWSEWGVVEAESRGDAELRYAIQAEGRVEEEPAPMPETRPAGRRAAPRADIGPALGLFGYPGKN